MEKVIEKAIEGGWNPYNGEHTSILEYGDYSCEFKTVCDPLFWQALAKSCRWDKFDMFGYEMKKYTNQLAYYAGNMKYTQDDYNRMDAGWMYQSLKFHEINLTKSWDKAVEYLQDLILSNPN